jgi:hypothetical protein
VAERESFKFPGPGDARDAGIRQQAVLTNTGAPANLLEESLKAVT